MKRLLVAMLALSMLIGATAIIAGCGTDDAEETGFEWRYQVAFEEADMEYQALEPFVEAVEEESDGELTINAYPSGQIVPPAEQLEAVSMGTIDASHSFPPYYRGQVPVADIDSGLPGQYPGFGTLDDAMHMLYEYEDGALSDVFREAYDDQADAYYLGSHSVHGYPALISTEPLTEVEDFQGQIIRATGTYGDLMEALGASATDVDGGEIYSEVELGTLDALTWSIEMFLAYNLYEVAEYVHVPPVSGHAMSHVVINHESWEALPADLQEVVEEAYHEVYIPELFNLYEEEWAEVEDKQDEYGYEILEIDDLIDEKREIAMEEIWPEVAAQDEYTEEAMEIVESWHEEHGE